MKPIKKNVRYFSDDEMKDILGDKTIEEFNRGIEELKKMEEEEEKERKEKGIILPSSFEIVGRGSIIVYEQGIISRINGADILPEYREFISYKNLTKTLRSGKTEAIGITITINNNAYLSDIFENGAPYGIIKKNRTGVGATTLELKSPRNSIIVVPTKALAYSKAISDQKYLYVGSAIENSISFPDLIDYIKDETIKYKKIIVVADSLHKVIRAIGDNVYQTYFLMVDEIDIYQSDSTFRPALEDVIDYYFKFDQSKRCLVSATIHDFCSPEINEEDIVELNYTHSKGRNLNLIHTDNPHAIIKELIEEISLNHPDRKILIAYNKVLFIKQIIENLTPELKSECAILCSEISKDYAGENYYRKELAKNNTLPARINFATNPYFAGIDIKERFHLISVSNVEHLYTLLSPDRYLQIAGRCREEEGLFSETIVYNTKVYMRKDDPRKQKNKNTADIYGRHILEMAYDVEEYIKQAETLYNKYKSYELLDEQFVNELKDDLIRKTNRSYYGIEMQLVRKNVFTQECSPAYFNIDSLHESLRLKFDLYTNPYSLYYVLKKSNNILSKGTQNRIFTESQHRNEDIAKEEYEQIDSESLTKVIEEIKNAASKGQLNSKKFKYWLRIYKRKTKIYVECVQRLYEYIPLERLLEDLVPIFKNIKAYRNYYNAAIFWALDELHPFKNIMKSTFPENAEFAIAEIIKEMVKIYRDFEFRPISGNPVQVLGEFFATTRIMSGEKYKIRSHNKNGYVGEPISKIHATTNLKQKILFSGE